MSRIITQLWNGNLAPCADCGVFDQEIGELIALREQNQQKMEQGLTNAQKATFQTYIDCVEEYEIRITEKAFEDGFSLAAKLLTEALA